MSYKKEGSYTIELTLLMPFILAVFLMILFTSYYVHDRVIIEKTCYIASLRGALCSEDSLKEYTARETFDKEISGRLLCKWIYSVNCRINEDTVITDFDGRMEMKERLLAKLLDNKLFVFTTECRSKEADETKYLRSTKRGK